MNVYQRANQNGQIRASVFLGDASGLYIFRRHLCAISDNLLNIKIKPNVEN